MSRRFYYIVLRQNQTCWGGMKAPSRRPPEGRGHSRSMRQRSSLLTVFPLRVSPFCPRPSRTGLFSPDLPVSGCATPGEGTRGPPLSAITKPSSFRFPFCFVFLCIGSRARGTVTILLSALDRAALAHSGRDAQSGQQPPLDEKPHRDHDHQCEQIIHCSLLRSSVFQ
jgi:hypothetical protein